MASKTPVISAQPAQCHHATKLIARARIGVLSSRLCEPHAGREDWTAAAGAVCFGHQAWHRPRLIGKLGSAEEVSGEQASTHPDSNGQGPDPSRQDSTQPRRTTAETARGWGESIPGILVLLDPGDLAHVVAPVRLVREREAEPASAPARTLRSPHTLHIEEPDTTYAFANLTRTARRRKNSKKNTLSNKTGTHRADRDLLAKALDLAELARVEGAGAL
eukprot:2205299-Rhodomonas_salina.1